MPKEMYVRPLRRDARRRLADPADRAEWSCRATPMRYTREELRSLRDWFAEVPDARRGQGRKHALPTVLSICALARLAGQHGPAATERFARHLKQKELRALGAWRNAAGRWVAPSDSTICRVLADTDPDALQAVLLKWAAPRLVETAYPPALAADGKRLRGANRHAGEGAYFETVTLVTHTGRPLASRCCRDEGGEVAALRACSTGTAATGRSRTPTTTAATPLSAEDASRARVRHAPANNATLNNIALVFHRGFRYLPEAHLHFLMRRDQALDAILSPC